MRYQTEEALRAAIKANGPQGVYLLCGGEEYLVDAWKRRLTKPFSQAGAFNLQRLEGRSLDVDALWDAVEALPLMAERKCVVVEDLDISKLPAGELDKLLDIVADPPPDCVLIMTGKAAFDGKSAAAKKLMKAVEEHGSLVELSPRNQSGLVTFLKAEAKRQGCELSTDLANLILEYCGNDMNTLSNELCKICAYAGYGPITREHIQAVATVRTEARVFSLSSNILAGRPGKAMETLADLFELREAPIAILSTLIMSYVDLYRARIARDSGVTQRDFMNAFAYKSEYRAKNAFNGRLQAPALREALTVLCDCDRKLKSTGTDDRVLLEQAVIRLFQIGGR